jgi:hypothetical protein
MVPSGAAGDGKNIVGPNGPFNPPWHDMHWLELMYRPPAGGAGT